MILKTLTDVPAGTFVISAVDLARNETIRSHSLSANVNEERLSMSPLIDHNMVSRQSNDISHSSNFIDRRTL
jgi:hypothetical protein